MIRSEYRLVFDILKATTFHNESEICNEQKINKEYNGKINHDFE